MLIIPALIALAAAHPAAPPVALVVDLEGTGTLLGGSLMEPLSLLMELPPGRTVHMARGARAVWVTLAGGEEITVQGPARFRLDARGRPVGPRLSVQRKGPPADRFKGALKPGGLAQASFVMRAPAGELGLQAPASPVVRETRPRFAWPRVADGARTSFLLRDDQGLEVLAAEGEEAVPAATRPLQPGRAYAWTLTARLADGSVKTAQGAIRILGTPEAEVLQELESHRSESFARRMVYAAALAQAGLAEEADKEWTVLHALRPDDPVLAAFAARAGKGGP